jgi:exopolysaccharide biosynthesis polyprenyl glycosylphosphotransferase
MLFDRVDAAQRREMTRRPLVLGRKQEFGIQVLQLSDAILAVLSLWISYGLRLFARVLVPSLPPLEAFREFYWIIVLLIPFVPLFLDLHGFYSGLRSRVSGKTPQIIVQSLLWTAALIMACSIFLRLHVSSRSVLLVFPLVAGTLLFVRDRAASAYYRSRSKNARYREPVIVAGSSEEIQSFTARFPAEELPDIQIVRAIDVNREPTSELVRAVHEHSVGRVIFAASRTELGRIEEAIAVCEIEGVEAWLITDFIRTSIARPDFDMLGSQPMLVFRSTQTVSWSLFVKRLIDLVLAGASLIILFPFLLLVALAIRITSPGPAIFRQMRSGRRGRPFEMFKFRSMFSDAEQRRAEFEAYNQMCGPVFKVNNDPRITSIGRFLRRYSIDELPQLWNVLAGDMSLVGPRPLPVYEVKSFEDASQRRRLSVQPGITGLWQVNGRNKVRNFEDWVRLDLEYIDNWSLYLDLYILLRTVPCVLLGDGAH